MDKKVQITPLKYKKSKKTVHTVTTISTVCIEPAQEQGVDEATPSDVQARGSDNTNAISAPKVISTVSVTSTIRRLEGAATNFIRSSLKHCPSHKLIPETSFAVNSFQYGNISGVTHYFLTHYTEQHFSGLSRNFCLPVYMSEVTANLVKAFNLLDSRYIIIMELNVPVVILNVEVTAIDANYHPGAVMLLFKLPSGKCTLYTGDFRANPDMESEPAFWNNNIDSIFLDTSLLCDAYNYRTNWESTAMIKEAIKDFQQKNEGKRILYVFGTDIIGKERLWMALAREYRLKVWLEPLRMRASLLSQQDCGDIVCLDEGQADMHIVPNDLINFRALTNRFKPLERKFDLVLAFNACSLFKNVQQQNNGVINILSVEYAEHSNQKELKRFIKFLKPCTVISIYPRLLTGRDSSKNIVVPEEWHNYDELPEQLTDFQPSMTCYLKFKDTTHCNKLANTNMSPSKSAKSLQNTTISTPIFTKPISN